MQGKFTCGCDPANPRIQGYYMDVVTINGQQFQTNKRLDKQGNEICPIHGAPMYGSLVPMKRGPQGNEVVDHYADYVRRYGKAKDVPLGSPDIQDRRMNGDPTEIGEAWLRERELERVAGGNGKTEVELDIAPTSEFGI